MKQKQKQLFVFCAPEYTGGDVATPLLSVRRATHVHAMTPAVFSPLQPFGLLFFKTPAHVGPTL